MKQNVLTFGLLLGGIITANMLIMVIVICNNPEFQSHDTLGYIAMIIVFSLIFFGIRNYRNKHLDGVITFGRALKTGTLIALVASTMYVVAWLFYFYLFAPDFIEHFTEHVLYQAKLDGATESELAGRKAEMEELGEMYENPFWVVLISYAEVLPFGLVVALISSFFLKRKPKTKDQ